MPRNQQFEIPQELRHLAEDNVEHARKLYLQFMEGISQVKRDALLGQRVEGVDAPRAASATTMMVWIVCSAAQRIGGIARGLAA